MKTLLQRLDRCPRPLLAAIGVLFLGGVGVVDYLTGYEIYFSVFYLMGVALATWYVGRGLGLVLSVLSIGLWIGGDVAAGARYSKPFIPVWNATILLAFYCIVVWLLDHLRVLQQELETRVQQRTQALRQEIAERERLEKEILDIGERERQRIGHDLHDSLCQHLTATALAGQVLGEKLAARSLPEAADASQLVQLVEDGIGLARSLARGVAPVEVQAEGLMDACRELAASLSQRSKVHCAFTCESAVLIHDAATATHLYRIAQEAVANALRHGKASQIWISLAQANGRVTLSVEDNGAGLPDHWQKGQGLGTRIMAHRAAMMQANLAIEPAATGGTVVTCAVPQAAPPPTSTHT